MSTSPIQLTTAQLLSAKFIGVYRGPSLTQQRLPVVEFKGQHYDLFGRLIDLTMLVPVEDAKP